MSRTCPAMQEKKSPSRFLTPRDRKWARARPKAKGKESPKSRNRSVPLLALCPCFTPLAVPGRTATIAVRPSLGTTPSDFIPPTVIGESGHRPRLCPWVVHHPSSYPSRCRTLFGKAAIAARPRSHVSVSPHPIPLPSTVEYFTRESGHCGVPPSSTRRPWAPSYILLLCQSTDLI